MDFLKGYSKERVCTLRLRLICGIFVPFVSMIAVVASEPKHTTTRSRRRLILRCAFFLLTSFTGMLHGSSASAQVILRDTVVISPTHRTEPSAVVGKAEGGSSLSSILANVVIPRAGYLTIEYDSAYSLSHAIPTASRITTTIGSRPFPDMAITGRLQRQWTTQDFWDPCSQPGEDLVDPATGYHYARDTAQPPTQWQQKLVPGVFPNEQLSLVCSTTVLGQETEVIK